MANDPLVENLISLAQLDIDAIHAYDEVVEEVDVQEIKDKLTEFKNDHRQHVIELTQLIEKLGGEAPEFKPGLMGFVIEGFTPLGAGRGTEDALKALKSNEQLTGSKYEKALSWNLTPEARKIVERNREDERRHLRYVEERLEQGGRDVGKEVA